MSTKDEIAVRPRTLRVLSPATGEELATYDEFGSGDIEAALAEADAAQQRWRDVPLEDRAPLVRALAAALREDREALARLISTEMGKPLAEAQAEIDKCALNCDFYAGAAGDFLAERHIETAAEDSYVAYEPLGVVLAIMPWNFPFWQVLRFLAPALMAGNGALLKHSPNVSGCALAIEELCVKARLPAGLMRTLLVSDENVAEVTSRLLDDPRVAAVTLTGSDRAGASVGAAAGRALKKSVLELGGSDPFVVLDDADLETVTAAAVKSRFMNGGQSCIAAKRFIVLDAVADEFERAFVSAAEALAIGDPLADGTALGPMARADLLDALERQVDASVSEGATVLTGGRRLDGPGTFFPPTVLSGVTPDMTVFREETFGPVAAVIRARDEDEAVALANDTVYGLAASVWTSDPERGTRVGRRIRSGALFINAVVASDPRLPFGGTKRSGYGRELAAEGLLEFVNVRTIFVGPAGGTAPARPPAE